MLLVQVAFIVYTEILLWHTSVVTQATWPVVRGLVADGNPVQLVTVLIDKLKIVIARRTLRDEATNDSCVL